MNVLNKGQIVIPAEIRHRYGIKPGTPLEIREVGDHLELYLLPADPIVAFRGSLKTTDSLINQLIEEHKQEVAQDVSG
ncbi:AbrB/MazE/SpoVT family DNA-binding domain-containing protein [Methyloglobulus sp.]|uniref:AbrB/MazE/SpoVT family DNA-binding domain-containing protein n=1 Tax=Methyloglobulus sp. TaxID=2518622 RepID=UPI0032B85932